MNTLTFESDDQGETAGNGGAFLSQLPVILLERKWWIIVPAIIAFVAATATAFLLDKKYESSAILLVQAPSLPPDIIGSSNTEQMVVQRIEAIRQKIINRPGLIGMIQQHDLYSNERRSKPLSQVVETMREAIVMTPQQIDLGGAKKDQTISVELSFTYDEPSKAQAVTQQLMEKIVDADYANNAEQLTETVQFLNDQQREVQAKIEQAQGELAAFNTRYGGILSSGSMTSIGGGGIAYDMQISNVQREISDLEAQKRMVVSADSRDPAVVQAEAALAAARATYTNDHPDVIIARQRLEQAKAIAKQNVARLPTAELDERLRLARNQLAQLQVAKGREAAATSAALSQRNLSPAIQQQAAQLQQRVNALSKQSEDTANRLFAAKASQRAAEEQMGERLLVVDPPVIPDKPISPNRPLIIAIGALAGLVLGVIAAFGMEILQRPIRDPATLMRITGMQPLAVIPPIEGNGTGFGRFFTFGRGNRSPKRNKRRFLRRGTADEANEHSQA